MNEETKLLRLAAKAVGIYDEVSSGDVRYSGWNPFRWSDQALELATDLGISVVPYPIYSEGKHSVYCKQRRNSDTLRIANPTETIVSYGQDKHAATRRCIVMCAAKIGEEML